MRRYCVVATGLFVLAAGIAVTGGVRGSVAGIPFSARRVVPLSVAAWCVILYGMHRSDAEQVDRQVRSVVRAVRRHATKIAVAIAGATLAVALIFGAFTAAGADPYGYVSQADLWAAGNPVQFQPRIAREAPWPNAQWSFCPLGYRPSHVDGLIVPTYAPGLPLQMAALARLVGSAGLSVVVPIAGALTVWMTYRFARRVCRTREAALVVETLVACSPVFLFQSMYPMSDVPVTLWWLLACAFAYERSAVAAGAAGASASMAILTRPNLVPLVIPLGLWVLFGSRRVVAALRRTTAFAIGLVPGIALTAVVNRVFYGSPLVSGYGTLQQIYSPSFASTNVLRYPLWFWQTHSPYIFLGVFAPAVAAVATRHSRATARALRRFAWHAATFTLVLGACYLFYIPFDHWTYLRFVLPAIPLLLILATAVVDAASAVISPRAHAVTLGVVVIVLGLSYLHTAVRGDAFALKALFDDRYRLAAATTRARTDDRAVVLCLLQSGSLRRYADRLTVRYDFIDPIHLPEVIRYLTDRGRVPYLSLEETETADFLGRFGAAGAPLLQTPSVAVDPKHLVTLFGPMAVGQTGSGPAGIPPDRSQ